MNGADVKVYSRTYDGDKKLSKNFKVREFECADRTDAVFISQSLVEVLQKVRDHFDAPVTITSAYRTPERNRLAGGSKCSRHLYGLAADIKVTGVDPSAVASYCEKILGETGGVGRYMNFTHVDVRDIKARWRG